MAEKQGQKNGCRYTCSRDCGSVVMRHFSALGLSQSLALNLPLALIFPWVLGRLPASKGGDHKLLPSWGP